MNYGLQQSLQRIHEDLKAVPQYDTSQYSFLPQYSASPTVSRTIGSQPEPQTYFNAPRTPFGSGGLSRSTSSGGGIRSGGYADFPTVPMPTLSPVETPTLTAPELPEYTAPERDEKRIQALQQKAAAPGLARQRRGLERGIQSTRSIDNPTERKFHLTGMLEEYGLGLGDIISKADMQGLNEYEREYATQADQAKTRYGAEVTEAMSAAEIANQNLMNKYQQELADRNAMFGLQSQIFGRQGIQKQAEAFAGQGGSPGGMGGSPGMMVAGETSYRGIDRHPHWRGY